MPNVARKAFNIGGLYQSADLHILKTIISGTKRDF